MLVWVEEASAIGKFSVRVRFNTGESFEIDLEGKLVGKVFEPLKDPLYFQQLRVNPELDTIVWPNGTDLAPEFLYQLGREQQGAAGSAAP